MKRWFDAIARSAGMILIGIALGAVLVTSARHESQEASRKVERLFDGFYTDKETVLMSKIYRAYQIAPETTIRELKIWDIAETSQR